MITKANLLRGARLKLEFCIFGRLSSKNYFSQWLKSLWLFLNIYSLWLFENVICTMFYNITWHLLIYTTPFGDEQNLHIIYARELGKMTFKIPIWNFKIFSKLSLFLIVCKSFWSKFFSAINITRQNCNTCVLYSSNEGGRDYCTRKESVEWCWVDVCLCVNGLVEMGWDGSKYYFWSCSLQMEE